MKLYLQCLIILLLFGYGNLFAQEVTLFDRGGNAVGAREGAIYIVTKIEPIKGIKQIIPIRPITPITPIQPLWNNRWSNISLIEFFYFGIDSY